jgi:hypothetical protein
MIQFEAEIIEIKAKKLASNDKGFRVIFETDNPVVVELQKYIADMTVKVEVHDGYNPS